MDHKRAPRSLTAILLLAVLALVAAACSGGASPSASSPAASASTPSSSASASESASASASQASPSLADWPTSQITIVVGAAPGTANDLTARAVADYISKKSGQSFVVQNQSGGSGADSMATLATQPADGKTIGLWSASLVNILASKVLPYGVDDYTYVTRAVTYPTKFCVKEDSPITSLTDFVDKVKAGQKLTIGGPYTGSFVHLVVERFAKAAGIDVTYVPFDGGPATDAAVLGGHVDMSLSACRTEGLRHLAVSTDERTKYDPDTPTLKELGYDVSAAQWLGFVMKAGTDPGIVAAVDSLVTEATQDPSFTAVAEKLKVDVNVQHTADFTQQVQQDEKTAEDILAELGLNK
ncbi:MAG TPA: tripartite tricarboxylate transporter substrate binding protein [Candidatus Limnocylindrales bacterium]|nr:tripartite tricarboxylate transporter substrate binding protein [Candidatus Limnocylindrales bacterium]